MNRHRFSHTIEVTALQEKCRLLSAGFHLMGPSLAQGLIQKESMNDYPNTYPLGLSTDSRVQYPAIFDPALKQFPKALRQGEPSFHDRDVQYQWLCARRQVIQHLLKLIGRSRWSEHLVLHGSILLASWLGDLGRAPTGIDWIVQPDDITPKSALAQNLLDDLVQMVMSSPQADWVTLDVDNIVTDDIWTDERQEGQRILFPWTAEGIPPGSVPVDVVFGALLPEKPIHTPIDLNTSNLSASDPDTRHEKSADDGIQDNDGDDKASRGNGDSDEDGEVRVLAVSKTTLLAWKILWLETDLYPQGHDLYDAARLAENMLADHILTTDFHAPPHPPNEIPETTLSRTSRLLRQLLQSNENWKLEIDYTRDGDDPWQSNFPWVMALDCLDWADFRQEYPYIRGTAGDWVTRLSYALRPIIGEET
ncbi:MAG: nucleotidyl transferase AbiEii/AbiGii toxin family protein [Merismopedia sp. SIO2A8]|nr:nucleotidyl transferase AbiEii/AbiGii toxin family protein [Merismopedia sp. SIO2A8]